MTGTSLFLSPSLFSVLQTAVVCHATFLTKHCVMLPLPPSSTLSSQSRGKKGKGQIKNLEYKRSKFYVKPSINVAVFGSLRELD